MSTKNKRFRNISFITYMDVNSIYSFIQTLPISHFAYILHDKDIKPNSEELKEPHVHLILNFREGKTINSALSYFSKFNFNTFAEGVSDLSSIYRYLIHADDPDKFQYDPSLLFTDKDINYWHKVFSSYVPNSRENIAFNIIQDMFNGFSYEELLINYGREFLINIDSYRYYFELLKLERTFSKNNKAFDYYLSKLDSKYNKYDDRFIPVFELSDEI